VQRIEDPHHPRGYRELRSLAEMRKLLNRKIVEQNGICPICEEKFTDYADVVPDHKQCKGMGGAWRDDHRDNIQATQWRERINQNAMIGAYWIRRWLSRRIVQDSVLTQVASNCLHIRFTMGQKYHERKCRKMLEMLSPTTAAVSQPALDFMS